MVTLSELSKLSSIGKIIIHSLDMSLYQASAIINGSESVITDKSGRPLRERSSLALQTLFEHLPVTELVLRHESCYDEMINQPVRVGSNVIEVPLGRNQLG
ncbi:MAG: hypothetical protein COA68_04325 [Oceanobacter sp.]|jgi:hypothetical protein|nr:MAG: hypothetical protein COA68_04325 [Oceanobacter sp.]